MDVGDPAPDFTLTADDGTTVSLSDLGGGPTVLYFYPAAFTPGCTTQACDFRDDHDRFAEAGYRILGVSPDEPERLAEFREEHDLPFRLLSDPDHAVAEAFGAWGTKKNYGREYEGLIRSTFVIGGDGTIEEAWRNVRASGHVERLLRDLG
ncbi:MAG: thioredoxin-dependent thiol peroxidase [Acidimicrobiia bacterium]|nr:thioredoxin-dependent thiol peroxidase [Acidimicrobiia bacterium]